VNRREIGEKVFAVLGLPPEDTLGSLKELPVTQVLPHLLSALCREDEKVKWRAVTSLGVLVSEMAGKNPERARDVIRRMVWSLNEESGNAGWGLPEAMGEILARSEILAPEFAPLLLSYIRPGCNLLDFEPLLEGALWATGRLAETRPDLLRSLGAEKFLFPYLESPNPAIRGLSIRALGLIGRAEDLKNQPQFLQDETEIRLYTGGELTMVSIAQLARTALRGGV
jgi:hypothetical protein